MEAIQSVQNQKIKALRALRERKARQGRARYLVEGVFHLGEAFAAGAPVEYLCYVPDRLTSVFARDLIEAWEGRGVPCYPTTAQVFDSVSEKKGAQSIIGVLHQHWTDLHTLTAANFPWGVALVAPQDPGNVGTIIRTIDAVGASGLILLDGGADPFHPTAVRASMGALFHHPVVRADTAGFAAWIGQEGYAVYGSSAQAETDFRTLPAFPPPAILLLGSEREGLPDELRALCTQVLGLPMLGAVTSLNLAVAAGVLLYRMLDMMVESDHQPQQ
jgi:TrmH family RNA methyltransferase